MTKQKFSSSEEAARAVAALRGKASYFSWRGNGILWVEIPSSSSPVLPRINSDAKE